MIGSGVIREHPTLHEAALANWPALSAKHLWVVVLQE
jgi:hypothetical protein